MFFNMMFFLYFKLRMYFKNHELRELLEFSSLHVFYVFNNHELLEFLDPSFTRLSSAIYK